MNGRINHFESDCISAGFAGRKNIVENGSDVMGRYVLEFVSHLVNACAGNVLAWFKYLFQNVVLLIATNMKKEVFV